MTPSATGARRHQSFPGPWALCPLPEALCPHVSGPRRL